MQEGGCKKRKNASSKSEPCKKKTTGSAHSSCTARMKIYACHQSVTAQNAIIDTGKFLYKRQCFDGRDQQPINNEDKQERRSTPIHDRLGKKIDPLEQLEEEANEHIPDERPLVHENEYRYDDPYQWCLWD